MTLIHFCQHNIGSTHKSMHRKLTVGLFACWLAAVISLLNHYLFDIHHNLLRFPLREFQGTSTRVYCPTHWRTFYIKNQLYHWFNFKKQPFHKAFPACSETIAGTSSVSCLLVSLYYNSLFHFPASSTFHSFWLFQLQDNFPCFYFSFINTFLFNFLEEKLFKTFPFSAFLSIRGSLIAARGDGIWIGKFTVLKKKGQQCLKSLFPSFTPVMEIGIRLLPKSVTRR